MKTKLVFLAGPLRGDGSTEIKQKNIDIAKHFVYELIERGIAFYSPHLNISQMVVDSPEKDMYANSVNRRILECSDALLVLPGYETSSGTKGEICYAEENGMPIFYLDTDGVWEEVENWKK